MLFYLFPILWGALFTLVLCAPVTYYLIIITIFILSIGVFIYTRKYLIKNIKLRSIILAIIPFLASYSLCSFVIFHPSTYEYKENKNLSANKNAVVFFCNGEMEKYSPKYANYLMKDQSLLLKPVNAFKIKTIYKDIDLIAKNSDILLVAKDVKNSLLNYKPYFFYIAFSSYFPDVYASIQSAVNDGCSNITLLNYTNKVITEGQINTEELKKIGIKISITKPVYSSDEFIKAILSKIENMNLKFDGILLLDDLTETSKAVKSGLSAFGFNEKNIIIGNDVKVAMEHFLNNKVGNILYINLKDSGGSYYSQILLPKEFEKYIDKIKITGLSSWGYDKYLVKAAIETIKK